MVSDTSVRHFRLSLNKGSLQENSDFKEIWNRDIKIEELLQKPQAQRFGIMNFEFII
jgi:hypothetical protein